MPAKKTATKKAAPKKRKPGRPSLYSPEMARKVCKAIAEDGLSVRQLGKLEGYPSEAVVYAWLTRHPEFQESYARAKEIQAHRMGEEILEIADDGTNDWKVKEGKDGEPGSMAFDQEHVQRSKLRVDSRKWLMSKLLPKKYGDSQRLELDVSQGLADRLEAARRRSGK